jgi:hypothetical protein
MKTNPAPEENDRLSGVLREWVVDAPLPPRFADQVWHRIARAESGAQGSAWSDLVRSLGRSLQRPKVAYSYAAVLLALGVVGGSWTAHLKTSRMESALGQRYVQSVDPYRQAVLSP